VASNATASALKNVIASVTRDVIASGKNNVTCA
jgi:hypothetical protein